MFDGKAFNVFMLSIIVALIVAIPLAVWKAIDLISWVFSQVTLIFE